MTVVLAGASRGLGLELARMLALQGHVVVASQRSPGRELEALVQAHPNRVLTPIFDVTDEEAVQSAALAVRERLGSITHIVCSAAILQGRGDRATSLKPEELTESFAVNTVGAATVIKHFLPLVTPDRGVQVLTITSESASISRVSHLDYAYSISKAALNIYTAMLRAELSERSIAVAAIHPGWMRTDMGGPDATGDPAEAASTIVRLLTGELSPPFDSWFFDIDLNPLPM